MKKSAARTSSSTSREATSSQRETKKKSKNDLRKKVRDKLRAEDVLQTRQWVEDELSKLRMEGIAISSFPLVEVDGEEEETAVSLSQSEEKKESASDKISKTSRRLTAISQRLQDLWTSGKWEGLTRSNVERIVDFMSGDSNLRLGTMEEKLCKDLKLPITESEATTIATYLMGPKMTARQLEKGDFVDAKDEDDYVDSDACSQRFVRWCEEWTTSDADPLVDVDGDLLRRASHDHGKDAFTDFSFSPGDGSLSKSLADALGEISPSKKEITASTQAKLLEHLGLCGRSLEPPIRATDFVTEWLDSKGMTRTSLLDANQCSRCVLAMWKRIVKNVNGSSEGVVITDSTTNRSASSTPASITNTLSVYLGGIDGSWRSKEAVPLLRTLDVSFVDPSLFRELPDRVTLDLRARSRAKALLYVLRSDASSSLSLAMAAAAQIAAKRRVTVVVLDDDDDAVPHDAGSSKRGENTISFRHRWRRAAGYLAAVAHCHGVKVFRRVKAAVFDVVRLVEEYDRSRERSRERKFATDDVIATSLVTSATGAVDAQLDDLCASRITGTKLDRMEQLRVENAMLKTELGAIDDDFFADIEDLKFRYARAVREIDRMEKELRVARRDEDVSRKRHESIWDAMSKQLYAVDVDQSGCLPSRDFRRIACRHLQLREEDAHKIMQSLPSDVFGCVNYVAFRARICKYPDIVLIRRNALRNRQTPRRAEDLSRDRGAPRKLFRRPFVPSSAVAIATPTLRIERTILTLEYKQRIARTRL
eukprot:g4340.t1